MTLLIKLFTNFFYIGMLSFGGGMSAIPLVEQVIVNGNHWLTYDEFASLITIAEMTPGPIAVNSASFVGVRLAGPIGTIVATIGVVTPSIIIVGCLAYFLFKNKDIKIVKNILALLRPFIICLILSAGLKILGLALFKENVDLVNGIVFIVSFILLRYAKMSPIKVMLIVGITSGIITTFI